MANWERRERTIRQVEYLHRKGDCVGELWKALKSAFAEQFRMRGEEPDFSRMWHTDDWAWIDFDDEHVIIRFEIEKVEP